MNYTAAQIASIAHEANRQLQRIQIAMGITAVPVAAKWDKFEDQEGIIAGVINAVTNNVTPEQSHEAWCADKWSKGWTYGEVKDVDLKTHPCLVPYAQLPEEQKIKDTLFLAIVAALAPKQSPLGAFQQGVNEGRA